MSIGHMSSLQALLIHGCGALQSHPDSLSQLNKLLRLQILDCGSSLKGLDVLRALQGLRIWRCTSITELPGSCLVVVDSNFQSPTFIWDGEEWWWVRRDVKKGQEVEANYCGFLRHVREDTESGRAILQRDILQHDELWTRFVKKNCMISVCISPQRPPHPQ